MKQPKSVSLRSAHAKAVTIEAAEREKLQAAERAADVARTKARALFTSDGPDAPAYREALGASRQAAEIVDEAKISVAFALEAAGEADRVATEAERDEFVSTFVKQHPLMFKDNADAAIKSRVVLPILVHHGLAEGPVVPLHKINEALEETITANLLGLSSAMELALERGNADPIPGDVAGGRVRLSRAEVLARVRAAVEDARCARDPMLAARREKGGQIGATGVLAELLVDGDNAPLTMPFSPVRRIA